LAEGRPQEAITLLEKDRLPTQADLELALGRAYAAAGQAAKAADILRNLYVTTPLAAEAGLADVELKKLSATTQVPPLGPNGRRSRADLLVKGKRFSEAADEYRDLLNQVGPDDRADVQWRWQWLCAVRDKIRKPKDSGWTAQLPARPQCPTHFQSWKWPARPTMTRVSNSLSDLRQAAPTSVWLQQALLAAGNLLAQTRLR
jgi:tetratricopeptide (TPR) repeat protein